MWKVNNVRREFEIKVSIMEEKSNNKLTYRAGGQDLKSKQLSLIRQIYRSLNVETLHASNKTSISDAVLENTTGWVWERRTEFCELFAVCCGREATKRSILT